jgi:hypothetical protein
MLFGLACEGVTDQITLENILCGYFENPDLDDEIIYLQPFLDETDQKQKNFGGWQMLFEYLASTKFRNDVLNTGVLVIQVDTDDCDKTHFDVSKVDCNNNELETEVLIERVIEKLISIIESGQAGFYQVHAGKIIFCVSVSSLECWLYNYHNPQFKNPKTTGCCGKNLNYLFKVEGFVKTKKQDKDVKLYKKYSKPFLTRKNIDVTVGKDPSFRVFIQSLEKIELP